MKLLGAKEFIKSKPGTFYIRFWKNSEDKCFKIIEQFKEDPKSLLNEEDELDELEVYGNNSYSMSFRSGVFDWDTEIMSKSENDEDFIFCWDANVIGDANPLYTLYLVLEEDELPEFIIAVSSFYGNPVKLSKDRILRIRNLFVKEYCSEIEELSDWIKEVIKEYSKESEIFNVNIERSRRMD